LLAPRQFLVARGLGGLGLLGGAPGRIVGRLALLELARLLLARLLRLALRDQAGCDQLIAQ